MAKHVVATPSASDAVGTVVDGALTLEIRLFGQPRFAVSGKPHRFSAPPRTLPLLAYLLLHRGAHLTRENIAFALWPDDSEDEARANLRRHLHHLKEALPHARAPWFVAEGETVAWPAESNAWFDVEMFERCIVAGKLGEAVDLYAGDLLTSVYDDWIIAERERLRAQFLTALEKLLLRARSRREFAAAADCARRILENDPWREDILRQLMSIRYESGDRTGALHEFEGLAERLKRELAAEPMSETIALRDIILRGGALPEHPDMVVSELPDAANRSPQLPFVGRARELERLRIAWERAASGHGSLVLIGGEAGIGKSRLAAELALLAAAQGGRVLRGSTSPGEPAPYQAISEALRDAVPMFGSLDIEPVWLLAMSVLVPEVATRYKLPPLPPLDPAREQQRLFEALAQTFDALAKQRPLLVVLEDLHWAGASSFASIEFLVRQIDNTPLLFVATYRSEAVTAADPLPAARRRLSRERVAGHIALGGLSPEEVSELVDVVPERFEDLENLCRSIVQVSGGNPLFVGELLRAHEEAPSQFEVPSGVAATIMARADRLTALARLLAEIASVVGERFDVEFVREVSGYDENVVLDGVAELLDRRMVRESVVGQFEFSFTHQLIQETIYQGVAKTKRRRWHRRIAGVLERLPQPELQDVLATLARHLELAGEERRAAQRYLEATERALTVYAHDEAVRTASRGLEISSDDDALRFELLLAREFANRYLPDQPAQRQDLEQLQRCTTFIVDARAQCRVLQRLVNLHHVTGNRVAENAALEALAERAESLADDHWRSIAMEYSAMRNLALGRYSEARAEFASAAVIKEHLGDVAGQAKCVAEVGRMAKMGGDFAGAAEQLALASDIATLSGDLLARARAAAYTVVLALERMDFKTGWEYANKALELYRLAGNRVGEASTHTGLGILAQRLWRIGDAREHYGRSRELLEPLNHPEHLSTCLRSASDLAIELGSLDEAASLLEQASAQAEAAGVAYALLECAISTASIAIFRGDFSSAIRICRTELPRHVAPNEKAQLLATMASAEFGLGRFDASIEMLEESLPTLRRRDMSIAVHATFHLAHAYLAGARVDDAQRCVEALLRETVDTGDAFPRIVGPRILWIAGRVFEAAGEHGRALPMFDRARASLEDLRVLVPDAKTRGCFAALPLHREIAATR